MVSIRELMKLLVGFHHVVYETPRFLAVSHGVQLAVEDLHRKSEIVLILGDVVQRLEDVLGHFYGHEWKHEPVTKYGVHKLLLFGEGCWVHLRPYNEIGQLITEMMD